jgi:hypothetical protein
VGFNEAIKEYGKEITASFSVGGVTYKDEDIISMNPHFEGSLLKSLMKCLDIEIKNSSVDSSGSAIAGIAIAGDAVAGVGGYSMREITNDSIISNAKFGVKAPGEADYSYIQYGTYLVKEKKYDEEQDTTILECYDLMLLSMVPYDLSLDYSSGVTVKGLLDAICSRMGWSKRYTDFVNSDKLIEVEKYDASYTFRDVLDEISQAAAGSIGFVGDELDVICPTPSGEIIDYSNLKSLKIGEHYGPVNSIVLARTPQEDNIIRLDEESIAAHGLTEIRIENNQIMDSHREDFIDGILGALLGLEFDLYELESFGIGYLKFGDIFTLEDPDGVMRTALMLCNDLVIDQGLNETSRLEAPEVTQTDYSAASESDRLLNKTILRVDKQAQEISALVSTTEQVKNDLDGVAATVTHMSEVMMDSDSVDIKISTAVEGIDSVTTSTGYTFDQNGLQISKDGDQMKNRLDNTGMYVTRDGEEILGANNEGVQALNLTSRQFLIVGDNSRFENYNNGSDSKRTACFYIGG